MRESSRRKRKYMIIGLCAILLVMAVGYSAFQTQLSISATSSIDNTFIVKIIDIDSTVLSGQASNVTEPTYTDTTATFQTSLVLPGDSMQYDITVANQGTVDAVLDKININTSNNEAITFETSGIESGDSLAVGTTDVLTIVVTYDSSVTTQPESKTSTVEVTLDYVQEGSESSGEVDVPSGNTTTLGGQSVEVVTSGDGLYEDEYEDDRYVYRGSDVDNYITFDGETWRIIAIESNGTLKIVKNSSIGSMQFDAQGNRDSSSNGAGGTYCASSGYGCNVWAATANMVGTPSEFISANGSYYGTVLLDSSLNTYLNDEYYYEDLSEEAQSLIVDYPYNIGGIRGVSSSSTLTMEEQLEAEAKYKWEGKVALINLSDYIRSNSNDSCDTLYDSYISGNYSTCKNTTWMYTSLSGSSSWWTITPLGTSRSFVWTVLFSYGRVNNTNYAYLSSGVRPVVHLTSDLKLSGAGTSSDPYTIVG